jgi:hypothetical protein
MTRWTILLGLLLLAGCGSTGTGRYGGNGFAGDTSRTRDLRFEAKSDGTIDRAGLPPTTAPSVARRLPSDEYERALSAETTGEPPRQAAQTAAQGEAGR